MDATFRLKRTLRNQGLGFLAFFLAWFALVLYIALTDPTIPHRLPSAAFLAGVPLLMAGSCVWMLAAYWREELTIRGERVTFRGIFREKVVDLREVTQARWWNQPGLEGGLVLRTESTRLAITLNNYEAEEQEQIVHHARSVLPAEIQVGWNLFAYNAERRAARAAQAKPGPDEVLLTRDRWDRLLVPALAVASLAGVVAWWLTGKLGNLAFPLVPLGLWAMFRFTTPAKGMIARKLVASRSPDAVRFLGFLLAWMLVAFAGLAVNHHVRPRMEQPDAIVIVGAVVWFGILLFEAFRADRGQGRRDREAADLAAKARGEPTADPWPSD